MTTSRHNRIRSIVVATDFSRDAARAAKRAAVVAQDVHARLELLHVIDRWTLAQAVPLLGGARALRAASIEAARRQLAAAAAALPRGQASRARRRIAVGDVLGEILRAARGSDLLVLGARGRRRLRDLILGTTAERLVQKSTRPVLVVKRSAKHAYRHVVVGYDFSADASAALAAAVRIAPAARITLVHAYDLEFEGMLWRGQVPDAHIKRMRLDARAEALDAMRRVVSRLGEGAVRIEPMVARGYPARVVLDAADGADLIAVGKRGYSVLEGLLIGSLTRHVLADSRCDVLVARR